MDQTKSRWVQGRIGFKRVNWMFGVGVGMAVCLGGCGHGCVATRRYSGVAVTASVWQEAWASAW